MLLSFLLLLLVCSSQASHFYGTVMTYYPKTVHANGSVEVLLRYKLNFHSCSDLDSWTCPSGDCGTQIGTVELQVVDQIEGEWCQREGFMTRKVSSRAPFQLLLNSNSWIDNIVNNIVYWRAVTVVELRYRSDTGQANRSPQTTILPALRVPTNCQRDFNLLAFDPDGDEVKCRFANKTQGECEDCGLPSVLSLSSSCTLSFSSTNSSKGPYAVQLVMEDFPRRGITLTQTDGSQEVKSTNDPVSKIPLQFVIRVDDSVPSCTEGLYLPKFLPPTPENRARLYASINQTLEINISAEANSSRLSRLLFSGPHNVINVPTAEGQFTLRWTPSESENGESHPICFAVQAGNDSVKYHSELRCVIVSVGNYPTTINTSTQPAASTDATSTQHTTTAPPTTTTIKQATTNTHFTAQSATPSDASLITTMQSTTPKTTSTTTLPTTPTTAMQSSAFRTSTITSSVTTLPPVTTPEAATTVSSPISTMSSPPPDTVTGGTTTSRTPTVQDSNQILVFLRMKLSTTTPLTEEDIRTTVLQQIKAELVRQGLPSDISLRLLSSQGLGPAPAAPPGA